MTTELPGFSKSQIEPDAVISKRIKAHLSGVDIHVEQPKKQWTFWNTPSLHFATFYQLNHLQAIRLE